MDLSFITEAEVTRTLTNLVSASNNWEKNISLYCRQGVWPLAEGVFLPSIISEMADKVGRSKTRQELPWPVGSTKNARGARETILASAESCQKKTVKVGTAELKKSKTGKCLVNFITEEQLRKWQERDYHSSCCEGATLFLCKKTCHYKKDSPTRSEAPGRSRPTSITSSTCTSGTIAADLTWKWARMPTHPEETC